MMVKLVSVLATLMLLGFFATAQEINSNEFVATGHCGEGFEWTLDHKGHLNITGKWSLDTPCDISSDLISRVKSLTFDFNGTKNYKQTFENWTSLQSVEILSKMTEINERLFKGCTSLVSVTLPDSITKISGSAFMGCKSLNSISFSNNLENIGDSAFEGCSNLKNVVLPNELTNIGDAAFKGCINLQSVSINNKLGYIGSSAFEDCVKLQSFDIPDSVQQLRGRSFANCSSLTSIRIPPAVTMISTSTFGSCTNLVSVTLSEGLKTIYYSAFEDCINLVSINFPKTLTKIYSHAFSNCQSLENITIPDTLTALDTFVFIDCKGLKSVKITNGITKIPIGLFKGCTSLTNVTIPEGIESIGNAAFDGCSSLTSITLPSTMSSVDKGSFINCANLKEITSESMNVDISLDNGALFDRNKTMLISYLCGASSNYTIPDGVTTIGEHAFYDCRNLVSIVIPSSVTTIDYNAVSSCHFETVTYLGTMNLCTFSAVFYSCNNLTTIYTRNNVEKSDICGEKVSKIWRDIMCDDVDDGEWYIKNGTTVKDGEIYGDVQKLTELLTNYTVVDQETMSVKITDMSIIDKDLNIVIARLVKLSGVIQGSYYVRNGTSLCAGIPELCNRVKSNEVVVGNKNTSISVDMNMLIISDTDLIVADRKNGVIIEFTEGVKPDGVNELIHIASELTGIGKDEMIVDVTFNDQGEMMLVVTYLTDHDDCVSFVDSFIQYLQVNCGLFLDSSLSGQSSFDNHHI